MRCSSGQGKAAGALGAFLREMAPPLVVSRVWCVWLSLGAVVRESLWRQETRNAAHCGSPARAETYSSLVWRAATDVSTSWDGYLLYQFPTRSGSLASDIFGVILVEHNDDTESSDGEEDPNPWDRLLDVWYPIFWSSLGFGKACVGRSTLSFCDVSFSFTAACTGGTPLTAGISIQQSLESWRHLLNTLFSRKTPSMSCSSLKTSLSRHPH